MKKNRILRLGLLALALTLVTASLVSGTFAKYITTASGTGTVNVAKWFATLTDGDKTQGTGQEELVSFDLFKTINNNEDVLAKRVAPGTAGSFSLEYDTSGTEVNHSVTVTLAKNPATTDIPTNMKFFAKNGDGDGEGTEITSWPLTITDTYLVSELVSELGDKKAIVVDWVWAFGDDQGSVDTPFGETAGTIMLDATFTATQTGT